jgi:hypothetical protein
MQFDGRQQQIDMITVIPEASNGYPFDNGTFDKGAITSLDVNAK